MILTEQQQAEIKSKSLKITEDTEIVYQTEEGKTTIVTLKEGDYVDIPSFVLPVQDKELVETDPIKEQIALREQYLESVKRALRNTLSAENIREMENNNYESMGGTALKSSTSNNGETGWLVFMKEEDAVKCAEYKVKKLLKENCSEFTDDFVLPYLKLIDKEMASRVQTRVKLARMDESELVRKAGLYQDYITAKEQNNYSTVMSIVEQARSKCEEDIKKEVDMYLENDPVSYYRNMGYTGSNMVKLPFFELDIDSATDAILQESSTEEILDELDREVQIIEDAQTGEKYFAYGINPYTEECITCDENSDKEDTDKELVEAEKDDKEKNKDMKKDKDSEDSDNDDEEKKTKKDDSKENKGKDEKCDESLTSEDKNLDNLKEIDIQKYLKVETKIEGTVIKEEEQDPYSKKYIIRIEPVSPAYTKKLSRALIISSNKTNVKPKDYIKAEGKLSSSAGKIGIFLADKISKTSVKESQENKSQDTNSSNDNKDLVSKIEITSKIEDLGDNIVLGESKYIWNDEKERYLKDATEYISLTVADLLTLEENTQDCETETKELEPIMNSKIDEDYPDFEVYSKDNEKKKS